MDTTISDIAERFGVSHVTAWRWVTQGAFPNAYRVNPLSEQSPWRVPEEDVDAFEEKWRKGRQTNDSQTNDN